MSNFAIEGLISGFDTTEIINAMLDVQVRGPVEGIEKRIETETAKYNSFQAVNAAMLSVDIAVQGLGSLSLFESKNALSSDETVVAASAGTAAKAGGYTLSVQNLAKADQITSDFFNSRDEDLGLDGKFVINGRTIAVSTGDSLTTLATKINAAGSDVKASVVEVAPNQNRLIVGAASTGANKLELREVGADGILSSLGLINGQASFDYTVNADSLGALGDLFNPADTFGNAGDTFTIEEAGGQNAITVTLTGGQTISEIADAINAEAAAQGSSIQAEAADEGGQTRLRITGSTGIPRQFDDPNNVLFSLGVLGGVQSEGLASSVQAVGSQMDIQDTNPSTVQLTDGDSSETISVDIDLDTDSLQSIADKINEAASLTPGSDISAKILTQNGTSRLEISSGSGRVQFTSDPDGIFETLGVVDRSFKHYAQKGENAQFTFNGVTVNRESNTVDDLAEGVTFALLKESAAPVSVNVTEDYSNVKDTVDSFVKAFNDLSMLINEQTFFNPQTGEKGTLFGNGTIRQLEGAMASMISRPVSNLPNVQLAELNGGSGVDAGKIRITNRQGISEEIDLLGAKTIQDVLDTINANQTLQIRASVSPSGQSINLRDLSKGNGVFKIEEVDDGTTARGLGLNRQIYSDTISGGIIYSGGASSLADIGISLTEAGGITFDSGKLSAMLSEDPDRVKNLLQADVIGIADQFKELLKDYTAPNTGLLDTSTEAITGRIEQYTEQIKRYEERADTLEQTLRRQFTALEVTLAESQQMGDLIQQRLAAQPQG